MSKEKNLDKQSKKIVFKWFGLISLVMIIGGTCAYGFVTFFVNVILGADTNYDPIWMLGMIPLMLIVAIPVTFVVSNHVQKKLSPLMEGMNNVADGKPSVFIPTAKAGDFEKVYENFNKMSAEIEGIQVLRTEMMDSFSHELKTPLASINGFAKLLKESDLDVEKQQQYTNIIIKESDRLIALTQNMLLLSKLDAQEIVSDKKQYDLSEQIKDCIISLESMWATKNIEISAELPNVMFNGNPNMMESVWFNLLTNAIKFTPKNGEINVEMTVHENTVSLTITDSGIGMEEDVAIHIFERYYQENKSHSEGGHGLGLAIVKRTVNLCGGRITVKSKVGEGSAFTVTLPIN